MYIIPHFFKELVLNNQTKKLNMLKELFFLCNKNSLKNDYVHHIIRLL